MRNRKLSSYPENGPRSAYLGISVLATIVLYYELYVQGAVATKITATYHMSFVYLVGVLVVGNGLGALASFAAGLADRWGRSNLVAYGLVITGLLTTFALPGAHTKMQYGIAFAALCIVEGAVLVASPALIRDFSPQLGRASAMGFWTLGPVLGSVIVTVVSSHTLGSHPDWRFQYHVAGVVGLVVAAIAVVGLRELAPALRDQLMVSMRDKALIEARAAGVDTQAATTGVWRQMMAVDIVVPAFAISLFLIFYYVAVAFFVVYMATAFGYSEARANALATWYWVANAIALVVCGLVSDKLRVRKPFMVLGGVISAAGLALFAAKASHDSASYYGLAAILVVIATGGGIAYVAWMAAFTETVEKHNPAGTATGLAVWGMVLRSVVTVTFLILPHAVSAAGPLVDNGTRAQALQKTYASQIATASLIDSATAKALAADATDVTAQAKAVSELAAKDGITPAEVVRAITLQATYPQEIAAAQQLDTVTAFTLATDPADAKAQAAGVAEIAKGLGLTPAQAALRLAGVAKVSADDLSFLQFKGQVINAAATRLKALSSVPAADLAFLQAEGSKLQQAQKDVHGQWEHWWWFALVAQLLFIPSTLLLTGRWSVRKAKADAVAHEEAVTRELAALGSAQVALPVPRENQERHIDLTRLRPHRRQHH